MPDYLQVVEKETALVLLITVFGIREEGSKSAWLIRLTPAVTR